MSDLMSLRFLSLRQPAVPTALDNPLQTLRLALRTHLTRQSLPDLSVRELADIGLTTEAALAEAARLLWDTTPGPRRGTKRGIVGHMQQAFERARTRRLIARMQARDLCDIGVSLTDAQAEASKPFWRP